MKFSSLEYGEKLSLGRGTAPKSRMEEKIALQPKPAATSANLNNEGYLIGQRMRRTTDNWFKMPDEEVQAKNIVGPPMKPDAASLYTPQQRSFSAAGKPTNRGVTGVRETLNPPDNTRHPPLERPQLTQQETSPLEPKPELASTVAHVPTLSPTQLLQPRVATPQATVVPNRSRASSVPFRPAQGTMYADPTLGTAIPRTRELHRGTHPMYRTVASQAYGAGLGPSNLSDPNKTVVEPTTVPPTTQKTSDLLSYNEKWQPRPNAIGAPLATATATTTQGGVPLVNSHFNDDRRSANKVLDTVVQRVSGPAPTSIGAPALEAIRKEKRYRAKISQLVTDIDNERATLIANSQAVANMAMARANGPVFSIFNTIPKKAEAPKTLANSRIPLLRAGGPLAFQTQILERLDSIQKQVRSKVMSRAGAGSTFEQQARLLQSLLEQHSGQAVAGTDMRSSSVINSTPASRLGLKKNYFAPDPPASVTHSKPLGLLSDQPLSSVSRAQGISTQTAGRTTELDADQLVRALRQGFAIPITADEADAFIDHCDVDEKGSVSVQELSEGIMAGTSAEEDPGLESVLMYGPNSPEAVYHKASDVFSYIRRKRLGALAEPTIRYLLLSIKARLLERSIANNRHLSPDNLAAIGSLRSYLIMILARFPTTRVLTCPEDYYAMLRQLEIQQKAEVEAQAREAERRRQYLVSHPPVYGQEYGNSALTNPITGAGGNRFLDQNVLRYGRTTTAFNKNQSNVLLNPPDQFPRAPPGELIPQHQQTTLPSHLLEQNVITPEDLLNGLQRIGLRGITLDEINSLLKAANASRGITPKAFVALMRGALPRRRRIVIREAFNSLDHNKDGMLTVDEVMANFDASRHPAVLVGDASAEEIKRTYMANLLGDLNNDGIISWQEFLSNYKDLSDEIENDDYFELMIRNCWHLSGGSTALATNTTNKRVLVTLVDGSQRVEEIKNDIGIRAGDKAAMMRRLEQQGVRGIKNLELYA